MTQNDTIVELFDICFKQEDIESLRKPNWFTDVTLDYVDTLVERLWFPLRPTQSKGILLLRPSLVFLLAEAPASLEELKSALPQDLLSCKYIFMPINDIDKYATGTGGTHWSLMVVSVPDSQCFYYDSMSNGKTKDCRSALDRISKLFQKDFTIQSMPVQQQRNGYDCGVHIAAFTLELVRRLLKSPMPTQSLWELEEFEPDLSVIRDRLSTCLESIVQQYGKTVNSIDDDKFPTDEVFFDIQQQLPSIRNRPPSLKEFDEFEDAKLAPSSVPSDPVANELVKPQDDSSPFLKNESGKHHYHSHHHELHYNQTQPENLKQDLAHEKPYTSSSKNPFETPSELA
ncbi:NEDD8 protease Nep1 [Schizosaccharomyces cryophilus OY26]|uniref:NEDD8 protease Nep1 n=1 Tax=Schizosaccharomyces cryophilus (strain OY26 / ATCC MYA-4695 / CBS 11777 / NBRC 106824 / NRRL Y48691) TaxID=653667 RepID=S9VWQ1_SCHCR|nr:NEDD8 protease Nep1 [Schizosaccharomyces cryophilus OY26]EPY50674.1 NEDD8 protease Nep1 [Schizosaccharomyces cryophilus OY26]